MSRTVEELDETMSYAEFLDWVALNAIRVKEAETRAGQAEKGMKKTPNR